MSTPASPATAADTGTVHLPSFAPPTNINMVAGLRDLIGLLNNDARDLHNNMQTDALEEATSRLAWREPRELLDVLAVERGLSWVDIARMVGVSIPALRKWRHGENVAPDNRRKLAQLTAFLSMIGTAPIVDPAAWMEIRIASETTLTPADIYAADRADLLLERAFERITARELLDQFDAQWQRNYPVDDRFVARVAEDGNTSLVERSER